MTSLYPILTVLVATTLGLPLSASAQGPEPVGLHVLAQEALGDEPVSLSLTRSSSKSMIPLQPPPASKRLCGTVFGYLPYWEEADNIRHELLTHIACFGVNINENGSLGDDHGWPWTDVINTAHAQGVKIILVATLFNPDDILTLITTPSYKSAFFVNIKNKMLEGSADGLNIDLEGAGTWRSYINGFMADLTAYLHAELPGTEVTFAGPAVNWGDTWDLLGLAQSCDGIFIMGYNYYGSWSSTTGPSSPLIGGSINITDTVLDEYGDVVASCPEKLILGIPYYGNHWIAASSEPRAAAIDHVSSTRFYNDQPNSEYYGLLWDEVSQTPWYRWYDGSDWHQVWFDNADSLGLKYALAKDVGLQGVGMWALNYDHTRDELWDELDRRYGTGCFAPVDYDADGDVDQADFGHFQVCLTGDGRPQTDPACQDALLDTDSDVDALDFAIFEQCMSGPDLPAEPTCAE